MRLFVKFVIRAYYLLLFRVEVIGLRNYPPGAKILCPNHSAYQDPVVVGAFLPDFVSFMAKKETFKYKAFNWFLRFAGGFPVDRDGADLTAIRTSLKILKEDRGLLIFAEGTRNKTLEPLISKPGVAMLAIKAKVPVIPITIDSTFRPFSKIRIIFHPPITFDAYYDQKLNQAELQKLSQSVIDLVYTEIRLKRGERL